MTRGVYFGPSFRLAEGPGDWLLVSAARRGLEQRPIASLVLCGLSWPVAQFGAYIDLVILVVLIAGPLPELASDA